MKLEIVKGAQSAKKKSKANTAPISEEGMTFSGLGSALDDLRQNLAASHGGIFPHSVLTSQHISLLASQKPVTMEEVQKCSVHLFFLQKLRPVESCQQSCMIF